MGQDHPPDVERFQRGVGRIASPRNGARDDLRDQTLVCRFRPDNELALLGVDDELRQWRCL